MAENPQKNLTWVGYLLGQDWLFEARNTFEFLPSTQGGCTFKQTHSYKGLLATPIFLFFGPRIQNYLEKMNAGLKSICEEFDTAPHHIEKVDVFG